MKSFYMIYVEGCDSPKAKHDTLWSATNEAKRLSVNARGKNVHILHRIGVCMTPPPAVPEPTFEWNSTYWEFAVLEERERLRKLALDV